MKRIVGQCSKCGEAAHPKGNVFRIMGSVYFDLEFPHAPPAPTEYVKVCNNCNTAHAFHRRTSAKAKRLQATIDWLNEQST